MRTEKFKKLAADECDRITSVLKSYGRGVLTDLEFTYALHLHTNSIMHMILHDEIEVEKQPKEYPGTFDAGGTPFSDYERPGFRIPCNYVWIHTQSGKVDRRQMFTRTSEDGDKIIEHWNKEDSSWKYVRTGV